MRPPDRGNGAGGSDGAGDQGFQNPGVKTDQDNLVSVQRGRIRLEFLPAPTSGRNPGDYLTLEIQLEIKRVECKFNE